MKRALALLVLACGLGEDARAQPPPPDLVDALAATKSGGCKGQPGLDSALHATPALNETARRIAGGEAPSAAARAAGYRAHRLFVATLSGYPTPAAVAKAMAERNCKALRDPVLTDVGVHQRGASWWIVLAAPFAPPPQSAAADVATRVLTLTNEARSRGRRCGSDWFAVAPSVVRNALLERAAAAHARDMARHSMLEHEGSEGSSPAQRVTRAGYRWRSVGENIASGQTTPEQVMQEWIGSPVHCANLMDPGFTEMGVAFAVDTKSESGIYWVQKFGRPR